MPALERFSCLWRRKMTEGMAMIDFKVEIQKFAPVLGTDEVDRLVQSDESSDIMDLLQYIAQKVDPDKE
jgi:hypothetical protein